jgi:uncharacterized membrane-anchored protein YitT (DUF2179 family)
MNLASLMKIMSSFYTTIMEWLPAVMLTLVMIAVVGFVIYQCCKPERKMKTYVVVKPKERDDSERRSSSKRRSSSRGRGGD